MTTDSSDRFLSVTELAGDEVAAEQVQRMADRYAWAAGYCGGRDVVEVACGTGQGLGVLAEAAGTIIGGDISPTAVERARAHYAGRVDVMEFGADTMPFPDKTRDVVVIFEAIYYLPDLDAFLQECKRVLRPGGHLLIATANKDLPDFNPSPFSNQYYNMEQLSTALENSGFSAEFFGNTPLDKISLRQKALRPVKAAAVRLNLMPKTMAGKRVLKRLMFGSLVPMPFEVSTEDASGVPATPLLTPADALSYKVILCAGQLES